MVPIPTEPDEVVSIVFPPIPILILSSTVSKPSSNVNLVSVSKSSLFLNNTELLNPGGANVTVIATPGFAVLVPVPSATTPRPLKSNCVVLLNPPVRVPSSKTLREPGMIPPLFGTQYLSPGLSRKPTTTNCSPVGKLGEP